MGKRISSAHFSARGTERVLALITSMTNLTQTMRIWNTKGVAWTRFGDRWLDGAFDYNERKWTGQCRQDAGKIQAEFNTNGVREWRNLQSQRSSSVTRVATL